MMVSKVFFVCLFGVLCINSAISVPAVTKCKTSDPKCMKRSAQALIPIFTQGIPEYGVEKLDPVKLKHIDASSANLKLFVNDMVVTGLKSCVVKKIEWKGSKLLTNLLCNVRAEGQYEMHGKLLILPIEGKGDSQVVLNKMQMNVENEMEQKTGKDGKTHWHVKKSDYSYDLKDKAHVNFENLFSGNEILARTAQDLIANNGNEIVMEIGPPVIKAIVDKIVENINHFYKAVPIEELTLN